MWSQAERIMRDATNRIVDSIAEFLPGFFALLVLLVGAVIVSVIARLVVQRMLRGFDFDRRAKQWGLGLLSDWSASKSPAALVARAAQWTVLVFGLLVALTALRAAMPTQFALSIFEYVPHVLAALIVLVLGTVVSQFLSRAVLIGAVNMQIKSARLVSLGVRWIVMTVAVAMALEQLQIGQQILVLAFGILFGGVIFAVALAVGLGARDAVSRAIERYQEDTRRAAGDRIDHV
jgi:hypothetical protein